MLSGLASGKLASAPRHGTSANGTDWANCVIRCPTGTNREGEQEQTFVTVCAFGDQAQRLARLAVGDSIAAQGNIRQTEYTTKTGEHRHGLEMVGAEILTAYALRQRRGTPDDQGQARSSHQRQRNGHDDYDDAIGF